MWMIVQIQLGLPVVLVNVVKTTREHIVVTVTVQDRLLVRVVYAQVKKNVYVIQNVPNH